METSGEIREQDVDKHEVNVSANLETPPRPQFVPSSTARRPLLVAVWIALAAWTLLLSIGTSLHAPAPGAAHAASVDWRRGALVFAFVGGFLSLWIWLASRKRTSRHFREGFAITDHRRDGIQSGQSQSGQQRQEDQ